MNWIGLCIGRPKCVVANSKSTRSMLISACNSIKRLCFRCENLVHEPPPPQSASSPIEYKLFYKQCGPGFRWLLLVYTLRVALSRPRPACHTSRRMSRQNYLHRDLVTVALVVLMHSSIHIKGKTIWRVLVCFTTTGNRCPRSICMCARKQSRKFEYSTPDIV